MTDLLPTLLKAQQQFATGADCQKAGYTLLMDWQALQISGDDADSFLQNLLTNDVKAAQAGQAQLTAFCQAKGRLLAVFWLVRRADDFVLLLPTEQAAFLVQRLTMFKLRSKVTIQPLSEQVLLGLTNTRAELAGRINITDNLAILLSTPEHLSELHAILDNQQLAHQPASCWQQQMLRAGLPMIFAASRELFTAQQVNLDLAGGVSFRKGCYPGQEVVARLHYLGEAKRRLFIAEAHCSELPQPGSEILTTDGEIAGHLVQACPLDSPRCLLQMTLKLSMAGQNLLLPDNTAISKLHQLASSN